MEQLIDLMIMIYQLLYQMEVLIFYQEMVHIFIMYLNLQQVQIVLHFQNI